MKREAEDLTGKRFGKLTVVRQVRVPGSELKWECLCDCGMVTAVRASNLKNGNTRSCGCMLRGRKRVASAM